MTETCSGGNHPAPIVRTFCPERLKRCASAVVLALAVAALCLPHAASAQFTQQGSKLTGSNETGNGRLGHSVALSADGNTAIVGGYTDNSNIGAAWVYVRSNGTWTQQQQLIASDSVGSNIFQGYSVSLSGDGNTALVGGEGDNSSVGAAWVYTRSNGTWTQKAKLIGTGATGNANQGVAVALSTDGLTAIVGGSSDDTQTGAAWIFTFDGNNWNQIGNKLTPSDASSNGHPVFGQSVAISSDGTTAIIGGAGDNNTLGAAWVFILDSGSWVQQGTKLTGQVTSAVPAFGHSVGLAGDGNTAIVGAPDDANGDGTVSIFVRNSGTWSQQGPILSASDANSGADQGESVALSADGNTAIFGGDFDRSFVGSAWIFVRSNGTWTQQGTKLFGSDSVGSGEQGYSAAISADGNTIIWGGLNDNSNAGAAWAFTQKPAIASVTPNHGPPGGGTSATISGTGFTGVDTAGTVTFGGTAATNVVVVDPDTITATTPAHLAGTVDVVVTNSIGAGTDTNAYSYAAPPTISSVLPSAVPTAGGTMLTITGTNLLNASAVTFTGLGAPVAAASFTPVDNTHVTAVTPAMPQGGVVVDVVTPGGTTAPFNGGVVTFLAPPTVTAINPNQGTVDGGTLVSIVGTNLSSMSGVKFGATASVSFSATSATTATATAPPHAAGAVNVTVTTPVSTSAAAAGNVFTYTPRPKLTAVASFSGGTHDGGKPFGGLIADKAGALYGTTSMGGTHNKGTVFKMAPPGKGKTAWTKTLLHSFTGTDGAAPYATLVADPSGNMYGTTTAGGAHNKGVVFKITPAGAYTTLYSFTGGKADGGIPFAGLVRDSTGAFHGVTTIGGTHNHGTLFKIGPTSFVPAVQHHFAAGAADGAAPHGTLVLDKTGDLYGTATGGGTANDGILFKLTPTGVFSVLHSFTNVPDGKLPYAGVAIDASKALYGVTFQGGKQAQGAAFKLTPPSTYIGTFNFSGTSGINPYANPVLDANKVMYGTTFGGGATSHGAVYRILPPANGQGAPSESVMYSFKGGTTDGANPYASVLLGKNGVLYGTASAGGSSNACKGGCGMVFMLTY